MEKQWKERKRFKNKYFNEEIDIIEKDNKSREKVNIRNWKDFIEEENLEEIL